MDREIDFNIYRVHKGCPLFMSTFGGVGQSGLKGSKGEGRTELGRGW